MSPLTYLLSLILLSVTPIHASYAIWEVPAYASANLCAQNCAASQYGSQGYLLCGLIVTGAAYSCLCDDAEGHSSTMNSLLAECPTKNQCGSTQAAAQGQAIFSQYCSLNKVGAAATTAGTARTSNPTAAATAGATVTNPQATSAPTSTTSDANGGSSSDSGGLSTSDKIAIACAIGGAIVTIGVAVPTWLHMKKKKRAENATPEAYPLHYEPPMPNPPPYYHQAQQPLMNQPYQNQTWGRPGWR